MKKLYLSIFGLLCLSSSAQIVNIPDPDFKAALLETTTELLHAYDSDGNYIIVDANADGEIQVSEALAVRGLDVSYMGIGDLTGILSFSNLEVLDCQVNNLTSLDVSGLSNLFYLWVSENALTSLNVSGCTSLLTLECQYNNLTTLNLAGLTSIETAIAANNALTSINVTGLGNLSMLEVSTNQLSSLDLTGCPNIGFLGCGVNNLTTLDLSSCHPEDVYCDSNPLTTLILKNGFDDTNSNITLFDVALEYICVDEFETAGMIAVLDLFEITNYGINSYCSFTPGGTYYTIQGNTTLDLDSNGCDGSDNAYPHLKFSINDGTSTSTMISNTSGNYSITVPEGAYTITPVLENLNYFQVSPASITADFPADTTPMSQNICITPNGVHNDLEIQLIPLTFAVPGFDAEYKIVYKNKGTTTQSGVVSLMFEDEYMDFVSASPATDSQALNYLYWNYTDLQPFERREINVTLNMNTPAETPPLNNGDDIGFQAHITPFDTDETVDDNNSYLKEYVVNSFDPNDKTCLEGATVQPELIGDYVHYRIRFENTGTFPAQNIVVTDNIDLARFDIATLVPLAGSHSYRTVITGNKVEFIFENIALPFDDANNDGYLTFKIKTLPTLVLGKTFSNSAAIYFDYNLPIFTNTATTTISALAVSDFEFSSYFNIYPIPANNVLNIRANGGILVSSVNIYNTLAQLVMVVPNAKGVSAIDISHLKSGNYFIKINSDKGTTNARFVKN